MKKSASQRVLYSLASNICVDVVLADGSLMWNRGKTFEDLRKDYPDLVIEDIDKVCKLWEMAKQRQLTHKHIFDLVRNFHERRWFMVTYEIVTPDSAEDGVSEESGYLAEDLTFEDAASLVRRTRTNLVDSSQMIEYEPHSRTVRVTNGEEFETGAHEIRTLHFPRHLSAATVYAFLCALGIETEKTN